jgi:hypothetical protein
MILDVYTVFMLPQASLGCPPLQPGTPTPTKEPMHRVRPRYPFGHAMKIIA